MKEDLKGVRSSCFAPHPYLLRQPTQLHTLSSLSLTHSLSPPPLSLFASALPLPISFVYLSRTLALLLCSSPSRSPCIFFCLMCVSVWTVYLSLLSLFVFSQVSLWTFAGLPSSYSSHSLSFIQPPQAVLSALHDTASFLLPCLDSVVLRA